MGSGNMYASVEGGRGHTLRKVLRQRNAGERSVKGAGGDSDGQPEISKETAFSTAKTFRTQSEI